MGLVVGFIELLYKSLLYFTVHYYTHTHTHTHDCDLNLLQSPLAVPWQRLPTTDVPFTPGSLVVPGLSYRLLTATAYNELTAAVLCSPSNSSISNSLLSCPAYNISARTAQKTPFLCRSFRPLPINDRCLQSHYLATAVIYSLTSRS
jgi:hypothetical protein